MNAPQKFFSNSGHEARIDALIERAKPLCMQEVYLFMLCGHRLEDVAGAVTEGADGSVSCRVTTREHFASALSQNADESPEPLFCRAIARAIPSLVGVPFLVTTREDDAGLVALDLRLRDGAMVS